jgi:muconolactone delta-isomerase
VIYLIDAKIDYNLLQGKLDELLPKEWQQTSKMFESGQLLGIWRKASANGVIAIWNMADHEAVNAQIRAMPLYPYMSSIEVTPLVAHPKYPQFCEAKAPRTESRIP